MSFIYFPYILLISKTVTKVLDIYIVGFLVPNWKNNGDQLVAKPQRFTISILSHTPTSYLPTT